MPCGASRETVERSDLAGWAGYGCCASHSRHFWGLRLHLLTTPDGAVVLWCLATPKLGDREVAAAMLEQHGGRTCTGVAVRIAQRLLALTAAVWHNWLIGAPAKRSLVAYDH